MSTKIAISMPEVVYKAAKRKADLLFGGNFSAYVSWLISIDNQEEIKKESNMN